MTFKPNLKPDCGQSTAANCVNPSGPDEGESERKAVSASRLPIGLTTLSWTGMVAIVLCGWAYYVNGQTGIEKTLTAIAQPIPFAWLLLSGLVLSKLSLACRTAQSGGLRQAMLPLLLWFAFTICGTPWLGDWCIDHLESIELAGEFEPESDPPLDLLVVLGGGTRQGPARSEIDDAGDRVLYAAQLYLQGKVKRLLATGSPLSGVSQGATSPGQRTLDIWTGLGIPAAAIEMLPGENTHAEMQYLKQRIAEHSGLRVGLATSAWHLPRAMRLARSQGLTSLIPVAANHMLPVESRDFASYLPRASNFLRLERCQHEFMARLVSR